MGDEPERKKKSPPTDEKVGGEVSIGFEFDEKTFDEMKRKARYPRKKPHKGTQDT